MYSIEQHHLCNNFKETKWAKTAKKRDIFSIYNKYSRYSYFKWVKNKHPKRKKFVINCVLLELWETIIIALLRN